jgi:hypothetical protein
VEACVAFRAAVVLAVIASAFVGYFAATVIRASFAAEASAPDRSRRGHFGSRIFGGHLGPDEQKAINELRNSSNTAKLIIDTLANSKTRYFIDFTSGYAGFSGAEARLPPWYPASDWGIKINPEDIKESLWEDSRGNFFQPDLLRVLGHELAHLFIYERNISPEHATGPFAQSDEAIWYENQISHERGILPGYTYVPERVLDHFKWIPAPSP